MTETLVALFGTAPPHIPPVIHYSLIIIFLLCIAWLLAMAFGVAFKMFIKKPLNNIKNKLVNSSNQEKNRNKVQPWGKRTVFIKMYNNDIRVAKVHYGQSGVYTYWSESELPTTIVMLLPKGRVSGSMVNDWGPHSGWPQEDIQKYYIGE